MIQDSSAAEIEQYQMRTRQAKISRRIAVAFCFVISLIIHSAIAECWLYPSGRFSRYLLLLTFTLLLVIILIYKKNVGHYNKTNQIRS